MLTIYYNDSRTTRQITLQEFARGWQQHDSGVYWVDMENANEAEDETLLISMLQVHPLTVEDVESGKDAERHLPKAEDFGDYLFIIFNPLLCENAGGDGSEAVRRLELKTVQLSAYLFKNLLVTHHYENLTAISNARKLCEKNPQFLSRGPNYLFHIIIDPW